MILKDGFYLYIISTVWNETKIQTVKMFFDCRNNVVRIPLFDENEFSLVCWSKQTYCISECTEDELMSHLDSFRNDFAHVAKLNLKRKSWF